MSKWTQEDAGEDRVTAKSKPMINLVAQCSERTPDVLASTASESPGENQIWKSITSELVDWAASLNREDLLRTLAHQTTVRLLRMKHWRKVVFSRVEIWWNVGSKNGETRGWTTVHPAHRQVCHWWRWYGLSHRHGIEPFAQVTVILAQSERSIAKKAEPFSRRFNARHRQALFNLENVYVFNIGSICIHGKEILRKFTFHQKQREQSHNETDVRHIWKVDSRTIRWDLRNEYN